MLVDGTPAQHTYVSGQVVVKHRAVIHLHAPRPFVSASATPIRYAAIVRGWWLFLYGRFSNALFFFSLSLGLGFLLLLCAVSFLLFNLLGLVALKVLLGILLFLFLLVFLLLFLFFFLIVLLSVGAGLIFLILLFFLIFFLLLVLFLLIKVDDLDVLVGLSGFGCVFLFFVRHYFDLFISF